METIKIKVEQSTKTEVEHEITLPHYRKSRYDIYKVISEDRVLNVTFGGSFFGIGVTVISMAFREGTKECTEEEYVKAFEETTDLLSLLK